MLGQRKLLQRLVPGLIHAAIFWGFLVLFPTIVIAMIGAVEPRRHAPVARPPGLVRVHGRPVRGARARRRDRRGDHPEGPAPGALRGQPSRRGRPDPRADRRDRDDAAPLARLADRARAERVAGGLVARLERALEPVRRRRRDEGARARLRMGARADHPHLPRVPAALEAPPHRHGGRSTSTSRARAREGGSSRCASTCPRRRCASAPAPCPTSPGSRRSTRSRAPSAAAARTCARRGPPARSCRPSS